jgi:hypothetical protein
MNRLLNFKDCRAGCRQCSSGKFTNETSFRYIVPKLTGSSSARFEKVVLCCVVLCCVVLCCVLSGIKINGNIKCEDVLVSSSVCCDLNTQHWHINM